MEDRDINKILVSKKASYGKESTKYYIGYNDDDDDDDDDDDYDDGEIMHKASSNGCLC